MSRTRRTAWACVPNAASFRELALSGGGRLVAVWCVDARGATLMPCGRCRQLLSEFGGPTCEIQTPQGLCTLTEILPQAFGPADLAAVREP